jgi:AcrR family transcriptional regulator
MMRQGHQPTVAEAAKAAGVHRATAYRYFATGKALLAEAALAVVDIDPDKVLAGVDDDPISLIDTSVVAVSELMFREEALFRQNLLVVLEEWFARHDAREERQLPIRSTRRFSWIDRTLEPLEATLDAVQLRRLRSALALTFGAEAVIVTRDICRLDEKEATEVMRWASASLIRAAIAEAQAEAGGAEEEDPDAEAFELGHG